MRLFLLVIAWGLKASFPFNHDEDIRWSQDRKLSYSDFIGAVPVTSPWTANTNSTIYFTYQYNNDELAGVLVYSTFTPSKSWMKKKTPEILHHEQLHFDITELYARKLYQWVSAKIGTTENTTELSQLFRQANDECNQMQEQYDQESEHGVNEEKQQGWEKQISELLRHTPAYSLSGK